MPAAKFKNFKEAVENMRRMSLVRSLRYRYEGHWKAVRDRYGEDEYISGQARAKGRAEGIAEGWIETILQFLEKLGRVYCGRK